MVIVANNYAYPGGDPRRSIQREWMPRSTIQVLRITEFVVLSFDLYDVEPNPTALSSNALAGINLDLAKFTTQATINFEDSDFNSVTGGYNSEVDLSKRVDYFTRRPRASPSRRASS